MPDTVAAHRHVYELVAGGGEGRVCEAIPEEACSEVPRNFLLNVANGACTKLAEQLASPGLVLPWLYAAIGAPASLAGALLPVRRAGSLLPQLLVAGRIRRLARRKWAWVAAGSSQAIFLALMIPAVLGLPPAAAGAVVLGLMALWSIASGVGSVSFQDVMGKTVPRWRRGRMLGLRATLGGILTVTAGILIKTRLDRDGSVAPYLTLLAGAALLWALGALFFALIREVPGATGGGRNALEEAAEGTRLMREVPAFARYLAARGFLLLAVEISLPFYTLLAHSTAGEGAGRLGIFVVVTGIASAVSSSVWGHFSDRSSRKVMMAAGALGALTAAAALLFGLLPEGLQTPYAFAPVFFLMGIAVGGVRVGRKTYLIDAVPGDDRPTYVAYGNTVIGIVTLAGSGMGVIPGLLGLPGLIGILGVLALLGVGTAWSLPEAEDFLPST
ncbi:MAG: MFS transporter [bacterium]